MGADGSSCQWLNLKTKACRKTHRSQHAELVFLKARVGIADGAHQSLCKILLAADEIKHSRLQFARSSQRKRVWEQHRIEQHSVDCEVATFDVFLRPIREPHLVWPASVGVSALAAKGGNLRHNFSTLIAVCHQHYAKMRAYREGAGEHLQNGIWTRIRRHVIVGGIVPEQQIAHAATGVVSLVALGAKLTYNRKCRGLRLRCCLEIVSAGCHFPHPLSRLNYYRSVTQSAHPEAMQAIDSKGKASGGSGLILAIESSCDETAAAVVERGSRTLSSVVASQIAIHSPYGGVVPELASREHLRNIVPVVRAAIEKAGSTLNDIEAIAVTSGPGLAGALLVGISYAKALAYATGKPLLAVNHIEGHIHAVLLEQRQRALQSANPADEPLPLPALALVVSGGHTHLYLTRQQAPQHADSERDASWTYQNVGRTVDDAAGEAFDKVSQTAGFRVSRWPLD